MWLERKTVQKQKEEKGEGREREREETIKVQLSRFNALYKERTVARDAGVDDASGSILVEAAVHVYLEWLCACREGVCQFSIPEATKRTITSQHCNAEQGIVSSKQGAERRPSPAARVMVLRQHVAHHCDSSL